MKKKYNPNNPILKNFIQTMDLLFQDEPEQTAQRMFTCSKCKKRHQMDLDLYKETIQVSRLVGEWVQQQLDQEMSRLEREKQRLLNRKWWQFWV